MARHLRGGSSGLGRIHHLTHAFPGEHYLTIRPIRDDARRTTVDAPRRGRRVRSRDRRKDERKISKLTKDTHKGKSAKTQQNSSTGRQMPETARIKPMGSKGIVSGNHVRPLHQQAKKTGMSTHRPRALNPHPPQLYHVLPIARLGSLVRQRGLY